MSTVHWNTLQIHYTSRDFPSGTVPGWGSLQTDWGDLLWAALTVGRPNTAYVFRHGQASCYEALFRLSLVRMALEQRPYRSSLYWTGAFKSLDPTEKGAVSYFVGMAVCKLFAIRLLNTPWVLHLDLFREQLNPAVLSGHSRPDLVGEDGDGAWHAFECKGRSSIPNAVDRRKAKAQAQRLVRVDSTDCSLHVGAISYFRQDELEFHWRDPDPEEAEELEPFELRLPEDAWRHYYQPALALATDVGTVAPPEDRAAVDINVEIYRVIYEPLLEGAWAAARSLAREIEPELREEGFQADGLKVVAGESWRRDREPRGVDW